MPPLLWGNTEFASTADLIAHLKSKVPDGMSIEYACKHLQIEHHMQVS